MQKNKGITLIALVVTIVVLIILATISINIIFNENGILRQAEKAGQFQSNAEAKDGESLSELDQQIEDNLPPKKVTLEEAKQDEMLTSKVNSKLTIGDDTVWIPAGFKVHEEDSSNVVNEGIVITDGTNEFVWVPVSEESFGNMFKTSEPEVALSGSTNVTSKYYSNLRVRSGDSFAIATVTNGAYSTTNAIREPDLVTIYDEDTTSKYYEQAGYTSAKEMAEGFVEDYTNMRISIEKYKGFYIGRYELTGTVDDPTVQAGAVLTASSSQAKNWYGLYKACRNVVTENRHAVTTMIWGCQWDETMNWLKNTKFKDNPDPVDVDSSSWGNYKDVSVKASDGETEIKPNGTAKKLETGITTYTMANNIYDLAGNYFDWTQEACDAKLRVPRGRLL